MGRFKYPCLESGIMIDENYHPPLWSVENLGPVMVRDKEEPYSTRIDRATDIAIQEHDSKWGIYRGKNINGDLVLQPTIIQEGCQVSPSKPAERRQVLLWNEEPAYISHYGAVAVEPIRIEFINRRVAETAYPRESAKYC
jgi:hypothetical protein